MRAKNKPANNLGDSLNAKPTPTRQDTLDAAARADASEGIRQGLHDVAAGRLRPAREFFREFEAKHGIRR